MRKVLICFFLCLLACCGAFAVSMRSGASSGLASGLGAGLGSGSSENPFDSLPMLDAYYDDSDDGTLAYWDSCTVSLLTVTPGKPIYSWFGHAAILVSTPDGRNITYDYGTFSFDDEDFFVNFAFGRLWFLCHSSYADYQLEGLEEDGRSVTRIILPFTREQKKAIIGFLNENVKAENRTYLYHHYKDNCATRLRDIIDYTTDGDFRRWAESQPGYTFRQQASRALSRNPFMLWLLDFLQSGQIDQPATLWDEMFLPGNLEKAVMEYYHLDNELVVDNDGNYPEVPDKPRNNILFSILFGLVLGGISAVFLITGKEKGYFIYSGIIDVILGILGSFLFFLIFFSNHDVTWFNENILFVNPLLFVLAVLAFRKSRKVELFSRIILAVIFLLCILKLILPSVFIQANWTAIIVMVLIHLPGCLLGLFSRNRQ